MHSQYKYKGDNRYLLFRGRLCRFNQDKINRIIESRADELIIMNQIIDCRRSEIADY